MTLEQYWNALIKRWLLIAACIVVVGLVVYIGSKLMAPVYQASAIVQVSVGSDNNQADISSLLASDQLVQTEAQLAISDPVLREVASHYPGLSVDQLAKNVSATVKPNTQLFEIDVLDSSPARAAALANDIANTLIKQQTRQAQQHNIQSQQNIQQDLAQTQHQITTITNQIATLRTKKGSDAQISTLKSQLAGLQQHYTQWQALLAQLELTEAQSGSFLGIAQPAHPASGPTRPNVLTNTAVGLLAGLLNGLLLALLLEQLDTRVRTEEALTRLVDWPVLATVWRPGSSKNKKDKLKNEALVNPPQHSANVESYRILRTNIGFSVVKKPLRSIMVTSAIPQDGKSTIAANLAIFMAKAGKKTLLIDADLRRPSVSKLFHLPAGIMGLSNAIVACAELQFTAPTSSVLRSATPFPANFSLNSYMYAVAIPNLLVMPAGPLPPNPPELLDSEAMERLFAALASSGAEVVIFDTPPLLGLSDANILAPRVGGVLVVVDITRANKKNLNQVKKLLAQSGSHVLGCVVNKQRQSRKDGPYSYYYYYQAEEEVQSKSKQNGHVPPALATPLLQNGHLPRRPTMPMPPRPPGQR